MADEQPDTETQTFEIPEDLSTLTDEDLDEETPESLVARAVAAIDAFAENDTPGPDDVESVAELADAIEALRTERNTRQDAAEDRRQQFEAQLARVRGGDDETETEDGTDDGEQEPPVDQPADTPAEGDEGAGELVEAVAASSRRSRRGRVIVQAPLKKAALNPTLADIARHAPDPGINDPRPEVVITAAADVPRLSPGQRIPSFDQLVDATINRAKALGVTAGQPTFVPLATLNREFPQVIDERMNPDAIRKAFEDMVNPHRASRQGMEALIAAGGWCAPSEIRYEFFQISEVAGLIDLPTFGVRRGGLRWPQSLSLADFYALSGAPASGIATASTMPWRWTEADDIAAVTGTGAKLCLRPPCPDFDEARLEVFGVCVTAGNLTEDAFPELIRHFIAQVVVAHARVMNRRHIAQMEAGSVATTPVSAAGQSAAAAILGGYALNAADYREKFGMRDMAVLEGVLPAWAREVMRSDIAKMNGGETIERLRLADTVITDFFDSRNIRMQWVQDWQTREATGIAAAGGAIPTNWPSSVKGLLYAPGTWGRGNGMTLDLGVVRDSVLNAVNDHTAAWSEEATLIAKFGHESRVITFDNLQATGHTGHQLTIVDGP